ncbi:MAG: arginine deiminase-related protein [Ferruginibacter sp.]
MQNTSQLLMIRPVNFGYNAETAVNNTFQVKTNNDSTQEKALKEFDAFANLLTKNGISVTVIEDTTEPFTPDSIFPNNWVSFHENGTIILYPMFADNRRKERKQHVLDVINKKFEVKNIIDFSDYEKENLFLEGTGSMVLDRDNKIVYACISPRTNEKVLNDFCAKNNYTAVTFTSIADNVPVYHTNVMMCVADKYVVICLNSIVNKEERKKLIDNVEQTSKEIIPITIEQMNSFAGNMLQVINNKGEKLLVMSSQAHHSLSDKQIADLTKYNCILHSSLTTIETAGGGSARCMLAEIFLL